MGKQTFHDRLLNEFSCAISSCLGSKADEEFNESELNEYNILEIANKVNFYLNYGHIKADKKGGK